MACYGQGIQCLLSKSSFLWNAVGLCFLTLCIVRIFPIGPGLDLGSLTGVQNVVLETLLAGAPQDKTPLREPLSVYKQCPLLLACFLLPTLLDPVPFGRTKKPGQGSLGPRSRQYSRSDRYNASWSLKRRCTRTQGRGSIFGKSLFLVSTLPTEVSLQP